MITAVEALSLPRAELSSSDAEAARSYLADIADYVREHMTRVGCVMPMDPSRVNSVIAAEIERALRQAGWRVEFQKTVSSSVLSPGQRIQGYQLALAPTDAAYEEADRTMQVGVDEPRGYRRSPLTRVAE